MEAVMALVLNAVITVVIPILVKKILEYFDTKIGVEKEVRRSNIISAVTEVAVRAVNQTLGDSVRGEGGKIDKEGARKMLLNTALRSVKEELEKNGIVVDEKSLVMGIEAMVERLKW